MQQHVLLTAPPGSVHPGQHCRQRRACCHKPQAAAAAGSRQLLVYAPPHPVLRHWLAIARSKESPGPIFRSACAEIGRLLLYEATNNWLPTMDVMIETPVGSAPSTIVDPTRPVKLIPVLRAGLILLESAATMLPASQTFHVGYVRNEETLQASPYLNKLPKQLGAEDLILISDPMLATGGTLIQVIADCVSRGASPDNVRVICVVCAHTALQNLNASYPGVRVWTGMIDEQLNDRGFIVPGLGDAGDRAFGT